MKRTNVIVALITLALLAPGAAAAAETLYLVTPAHASPAALRLLAFLNNAEGRHALRETGNLPVPR